MKTSKRTLLLYIAVFGLCLHSFARPIDMEAAKTIAAKFMETNELQLASTYKTDKDSAAFYVFNTADGFVIVAADDCETPIIGYSHEGRFDPNNVPVQMEDYLQDFVARIQYGIENQTVADETTARQWASVEASGKLHDGKSGKAVTPLLTDKWNQGCRYNSLCPSQQGPCDHAEVGCVAVAMGQIMHYWRYPATGWGATSYTNAGITLSAIFGDTEYDWEHMPDSLAEDSSNEEIEAVATLLFHCGVSVKMNYGANGSNAKTTDIPNALIRYFSYSKQLRLEKKKDYGNEEWMALLKGNLDLRQPVLYSGGSGNVGHAFVCDGYDADDLFHFNWGWGVANGYFALGNLNPLSYNFNNNNQAIFDIIPHYEPYLISALVYPSDAGAIEGLGEYHSGEQCTLTAVPTECFEFYCWERNGQIVSYNPVHTFEVNDDVDDIEAVFSPLPAKQIEASYAPDANNPSSPYVCLSWNHEKAIWNLLKQFESQGEWTVASDGEFIYTLNYYYNWPDKPFHFGKYTLNGDLVNLFSIEGEIYIESNFFAYDGNLFYCYNGFTEFFYNLRGIDMTNKTVVDSIRLVSLIDPITCSYDPDVDGFWFSDLKMVEQITSKLYLFNRSGERIKTGPTIPYFVVGTGHIVAGDGSQHLLLLVNDGKVFDYDIGSNTFKDRPLVDFERYTYGGTVGKYEGKDAMFVAMDSTICIYEINSHLDQIIGYRLYRANSESDTLMLADGITGASFIDTTWDTIANGTYRYGISSVYSNGIESEIIWSEPIEKTNHGITEHEEDPAGQDVQKVFENGQIVIIKDGKRYNMSGQQLN